MKKVFIPLLAIIVALGLALPVATPVAAQNIWHVDDGLEYPNPDYNTISAAVDASTTVDGDTIIVHDGTYTENVDVNKSLTIESVNGPASTIVEAASPDDHVFEIYADNVNISGFTLRNATDSQKAGIIVWGLDAFAYISDVSCSNNWAGIYLSGDSNTLVENTVSGNVCGIALYGSSNNILSSNIVYSNINYGIFVAYWSEYNTLTDNIVINNAMGGIELYKSSNNTITANTTTNNWGGIILQEGCSANIIQSNNIAGNTNVGILLDHPEGNIVSANMISNNEWGVDLIYANNNIVTGNTIVENVWCGVSLRCSSHNIISDNNVRNNGTGSTPSRQFGGITIYDPWSGVFSQGNKVYHNNFIGNTPQQAWDDGLDNAWDDGYPSGGNYWSDYTGVDEMKGAGQDQPGSDGIGDTPYSILGSAENQDRYPFMKESGWTNQPPVADVNGPYLGAVGSSITFDGSGSDDPDEDPLIYDWDWGDGNTSLDAGASPSYSYTDAGIYDVCLTVSDGELSHTACTYAVIYDPSAGFVTGGGWIDSPEGAYKPEPTLTGKATFGFVSKYKKGTNSPTGNTEFQFHAAGLNFHGYSYDWLLVTGSNYARFKGSGTINDDGDYRFMLWAGDGDPDTFRIKIWEEDQDGNETVIYDNGFDQAIGGGSIIIHEGK